MRWNPNDQSCEKKYVKFLSNPQKRFESSFEHYFKISKKLIYLIFFLSIFLEKYNNKKSQFFSYDNCNLIMFWFFNFCVTKHFSRKMHNSIILKNIFTVMRHFCLMGRLLTWHAWHIHMRSFCDILYYLP